jgi:hypothetical protein
VGVEVGEANSCLWKGKSQGKGNLTCENVFFVARRNWNKEKRGIKHTKATSQDAYHPYHP